MLDQGASRSRAAYGLNASASDVHIYQNNSVLGHNNRDLLQPSILGNDALNQSSISYGQLPAINLPQ
jgi:hypothetical protein